MENTYAIALDVGGTSLKSAIISSDGKIVNESIIRKQIDSKGTAEQILTTFCNLFQAQLDFAKKRHIEIIGIGIGMPGPFDYPHGISLIKGVDKYEALYGLNLRKEFLLRLKQSDDFPIQFENDAWSFVRGEAWQGAAKGFRRIIGLTLGTGFGSGFIIDDEIMESGPAIPPLAWIGGLGYDDGIVDDRVSRRGIIQRYQELNTGNHQVIDVKDIAIRADQNDLIARQVFHETGAILGQVVAKIAAEFHADCIVIGGQIAKSYHLFAPAFVIEFKAAGLSTEIVKAENIEFSALIGASRFLFKLCLDEK